MSPGYVKQSPEEYGDRDNTENRINAIETTL